MIWNLKKIKYWSPTIDRLNHAFKFQFYCSNSSRDAAHWALPGSFFLSTSSTSALSKLNSRCSNHFNFTRKVYLHSFTSDASRYMQVNKLTHIDSLNLHSWCVQLRMDVAEKQTNWMFFCFYLIISPHFRLKWTLNGAPATNSTTKKQTMLPNEGPKHTRDMKRVSCALVILHTFQFHALFKQA